MPLAVGGGGDVAGAEAAEPIRLLLVAVWRHGPEAPAGNAGGPTPDPGRARQADRLLGRRRRGGRAFGIAARPSLHGGLRAGLAGRRDAEGNAPVRPRRMAGVGTDRTAAAGSSTATGRG